MAEELKEVVTTKYIAAQGNGLAVNITKECRQLGVDRGDVVQVIIRKI